MILLNKWRRQARNRMRITNARFRVERRKIARMSPAQQVAYMREMVATLEEHYLQHLEHAAIRLTCGFSS